jgi:hypothetical protein
VTGHTALMIVQMVFAAGLAWSCFCRLVRSDTETQREIRLAIWLQGVAAGLALGAPVLPLLVPELHGAGVIRWLPGHTPMWIYVLVLIAATLMQLVTAKFWRDGPPAAFQTRGSTS